ncbi:MAG: metallophosphoesterase [Candidatus Latescibacterota bacterium]|nr:metallophosphoesterase [Candidatus Latescibacterota bacterium]
MRRTIFIGDIHGCASEFKELLGAVDCRNTADRVLITGDLFSRGPEPLRVWELIREYSAEVVLGNHDDRLLRQLQAHSEGGKVAFLHADQRDTFAALEPVFDELYPWLCEVQLCIDEEEFLLVHAGIDPVAGLAATTRTQFTRIRTWPPSDKLEGPRWHDAVTPEPARPFVFGHDAPAGLVVRRRDDDGDSSPWLVGLDSGCVYGGQLSAWLLEEDRIIQVESRQSRNRTWW